MTNERRQPFPRLLLIDHVAEGLGVSARTVRRLIASENWWPAASADWSGCIRMISPPTSAGSAACDRDDRTRPFAPLQVDAKNNVGNTSRNISSRMVSMRIPVMSLRSSRDIARPVLSIQYVPEGEINGPQD